MDFNLNPEQRAIQDMAKAFATEHFLPNAAKWDEKEVFPEKELRLAAELGLAGIYTSENAGGAGLGRLDAAIIFEELSAACPSTAAYLSIHNMVAWMIDNFADDKLRRRFLPDITNMSKMTSYCLTEPGSGSDAASLTTQAKRQGNSHFVLTASPPFISGGSTSEIYAVMCRTSEEGADGISCILVEAGTEGLSFGAKEKKMGWNSQHTAAVHFDNCLTALR